MGNVKILLKSLRKTQCATNDQNCGRKKIKFKAFQDFLQNYSNTEVTNFKNYTTTLFATAELT